MIGKYGVLFSQHDFKETCVSVKAAGIENGVLLTVECRYLSLKLLVNVLYTAIWVC